MEADLATWVLRALIATLAAAVAGLFARLRAVERERAVADTRIQALEARPTAHSDATEMREAVHALRLHVAERYVRADGYVAQMTGLCTRIDGIGVMVARLDERLRVNDGDREGTA